MGSTLPKQCRDAAEALKSSDSFETGQGILLDAAKEIERLENKIFNEAMSTDLNNIFSDLAARQEPLGAEYTRIWNENIEELYES